jgi:hypothetical protein
VVFDERERAEGVDGDVIPGGHGERLGVERGRNVAVGAGKDDECFPAGERLPMAIGGSEMAFDDAVLTLVFHDKRKMRGEVGRRGAGGAEGTEENGKGVLAHGSEENCAIGDLVEFRRIHEIDP